MKTPLLVVLLLLAATSFAQEPQPALAPLNRAEVLALLCGHQANKQMIEVLDQRGLSFDPSGEYLEILKDVGVDEAVLKALMQARQTGAPNNTDATITSPPTPADAVQDIETTYKGRLVLLRAYYRGNHLIYNKEGVLLKGGDAGTWTLDGHIEIKDIKLLADRIEIDGVRVIATCDRIQRKWHGLPSGKVRVDIELQGGNPTGDEAKISLLKVLFPPTENTDSLMPAYWKPVLDGRLGQPPLVPTNDKMVSPEPIYNPSPFPTAHLPGGRNYANLAFVLRVDKTGLVEDVLALGAPAGHGMSQTAVATLRTWKFRPGTKNDQPIESLLPVDLSFHVH
ncbi:MAG: hypothetical protein ABSF14_00325 [Terriglobia bacterium]|jgi:hypothetical protein